MWPESQCRGGHSDYLINKHCERKIHMGLNFSIELAVGAIAPILYSSTRECKIKVFYLISEIHQRTSFLKVN